jgi:hypothetical protein
MDIDAATFAVRSTYLAQDYFSQHADFSALIEPLPRQSHDDRLQLLMRQSKPAFLRHTSTDKTAFVESSRAQPQSKAVMHQHLHSVRALVHEQIRMVSLGLTEDTDYARQRGINPCSHVYRFDCEPGCVDPDHFKTSRSHMAHACTAELGHCTDKVIVPRRTLSVIGVTSTVLLGIGNATKLPFGDGLGGGGRALGGDRVPSARSASTTQRLRTLAFIERSSAAAAVDAPGLRQAATASALNSAL